MNYVKDEFRDDQIHALMLIGFLFRQVRAIFAAEDWNNLRQSHFMVISAVREQGVTITELADRVGMTKQGCGQFVTQLTKSGHLTTARDEADRRVRLVRRTPLGNQVTESVLERTLLIEKNWAEQVGHERYRTFRAVLQELALAPEKS